MIDSTMIMIMIVDSTTIYYDSNTNNTTNTTTNTNTIANSIASTSQ